MFSAQPGPGSKPINVWSLFHHRPAVRALARPVPLGSRSGIGVSGLNNGMQPLAGGLSLYRNGVLAGTIGVRGDGIDQDDDVAGTGIEAPAALRADQVLVRGVRLPYVKYPGFPNL